MMLWGSRFTETNAPQMDKFNFSISFDKRLWKEDIQGSQSYARALKLANILTEEECCEIQDGLDKVALEWKSDTFEINEQDEDIHTANERRLKELIGSAIGGKLHTGRSRNDQVVTDMRLWLREALETTRKNLTSFLDVIADRARIEIDVLMPGYTHLQRAQPIRWSHWLLSYASMLKRDLLRLKEMSSRVNICPLGSGALAGNPFAIDREALSKDLGFVGLSDNSIDAVSDRDFVAEFLFWASLVGVHLSRLAEDLVIYSSREFNFVQLSDSYSTGSSIMPQKKNPDSLELIRSKSGRMFGRCTGFMMTLKGLPSAYNKDFQEDKEAMFDTYDTLNAIVSIATGVVSSLKINVNACSQAVSMDLLATDLAYYLVRKGVPFREAHGSAGQCVALAEQLSISISDLTFEQFQSISVLFTEDVANVWNFERSVEQYSSYGGTSRENILQQIKNVQSVHTTELADGTLSHGTD